MIRCKSCGLKKEHYAKSLCKNCYSKQWRAQDPERAKWKRPIVTCQECGLEKPHHAHGLCGRCYSYWYRNKSGKMKLIICKDCGQKRPHMALGLCKTCYQREWNARDERLQICDECGERKSIHAHGLCGICYWRFWAQANPEKVKMKDHKWYIRNRDKENARSRKYYLKWYKERGRRYYEEHQAERLAYVRHWRQMNPEKIAVIKHRRRSREASVYDDLTAEQIMRMYTIGRCFFCGEATNLTLDHFVPIYHSGNTTKANIILACRECNSKKHTKLPQEILAQLRFEGIKERRVGYEA